ncbi:MULTISPECIES: hypothetical protein [unclassified Streptomyces]|uniref:hypothetical protein n=1 Tax=unclassified Streptomyces TaxID=2593676 RepID=UPI0035D77AE3
MTDALTAGRPVRAAATAPQVSPSIRVLAHVAALTPLPSGLWRLAIALGWDAGFTEGFLHPRNFPGSGSFYLVGLSLFAEALGLLTLGLVQRWGEELPGWVPVLGGRRVPTPAAAITAATGAVLVTVITINGALTWNDSENMGAPGTPGGGDYWVMTASYLPLLLWGPLLAVVTAAYWRRRRRSGR